MISTPKTYKHVQDVRYRSCHAIIGIWCAYFSLVIVFDMNQVSVGSTTYVTFFFKSLPYQSWMVLYRVMNIKDVSVALAISPRSGSGIGG